MDREEGELRISYDSREVVYSFGELDELVLCYATTIHKSQGPEYLVVVIPVSAQYYMMLKRNLIYTGITRGKQRVVLVGAKKCAGHGYQGKTGGTSLVETEGAIATEYMNCIQIQFLECRMDARTSSFKLYLCESVPTY